MSLWSRIKTELFGTVVGQSDYDPANKAKPHPSGFQSPELQRAYDEIYGGSGYGGLTDPPPAEPGEPSPG